MDYIRVHSKRMMLESQIYSGTLDQNEMIAAHGRLIRLLLQEERLDPNPANKVMLARQRQNEIVRHDSLLSNSIHINKRGSNMSIPKEIGMKFRRVTNSIKDVKNSTNKKDAVIHLVANTASLGFSTFIKAPVNIGVNLTRNIGVPILGAGVKLVSDIPLGLLSKFINPNSKYKGRVSSYIGKGLEDVLQEFLSLVDEGVKKI